MGTFRNTRTVTTTYTVLSYDSVISADVSGGGFTITLPHVTTGNILPGFKLLVIDSAGDFGSNNLVIGTSAGDLSTILGATTLTLDSSNQITSFELLENNHWSPTNYITTTDGFTSSLFGGLTHDGIYTGSGSLSSATTVTMATNNFTMFSTGDANLFDIDATNNNIGIGVAPVSSAKLAVTKTVTEIPTSAILGLVGQTVLTDIPAGNATAQLVGVTGQAVWNQTTAGQSLTKETSMVGGYFRTVLTDDGTALEAQGVISKVFTQTANGTVTEFSGIRADIDANSLGTIGTFIGLKIADLSGRGGTIPSANKRYGVYQEDAGNNYFNGTVGIKTALPDTALHVVGQVKIVDGSQGVGKVLTCDATGVGTWTTVAPSLRNVTATDTFATANETINCTSGTFTVNLPTAVGIQGVTYTCVNSSTGVITLDGFSSQTINGATTISLNQFDSRTVQSNGSNWIII